MSIENPSFDPCDKKYKNVTDLPEEEKEKFVDDADGFITLKAKLFEDTFLAEERESNPQTLDGKFWNKMNGIKPLSTAERMQGRATKSAEKYMKEADENKRYRDLIDGKDIAVPEKKIMPDKDVPDDAE